MRIGVPELADSGRTEDGTVKTARAEEEAGERPVPQASAYQPEKHPAATPARSAPAPAPPTPPVLAGLWGVIPPSPQGIPEVEDPADVPDTNHPDDGEPKTPGGDSGDGDRGPIEGETPGGPLRLSLVPSHSDVSAGEIVSVRVVLSEADDVSSVPFHVRFNDEVLEYVGAKSGPAFAGSSLQPILLASVNPARPDDLAVGLSLVRSSGRFNGSGTVVVLDFRAIQAGQTTLTLEKASVRDANSRPMTVRLEGAGLAVR